MVKKKNINRTFQEVLPEKIVYDYIKIDLVFCHFSN